MPDENPQPPRDVLSYYDSVPEEERLSTGAGRLEFARTREILLECLPDPPARVIDVGGAAGRYALWLARLGYEVDLVEPSPRLLALARRHSSQAPRSVRGFHQADARALPFPSGSSAAVIALGPLYHLVRKEERRRALVEAKRVLEPGGVLAVAAISRYASLLDGLSRNLLSDPDFAAMVDRDLATGIHENRTGRPEHFTTAYFHEPEELREELVAAGFQGIVLHGVEGPGWLLPDLDERWQREEERELILEAARRTAASPSLAGVSAHLVAIAYA